MMSVIFPPYIKDYENEIKFWTPKIRQEWLKNSLILLRNLQAASRGNDSFREFYNIIIEEIIPGLIKNKEVRLWEVISDGLGSSEPNWHGFEIDKNSLILDYSETDLHSYKQKIKEKRKNISSKYKTHIEIGREVICPTLFLVSNQEVYYFERSRWKSLNENDFKQRIIFHSSDTSFEKSVKIENNFSYYKNLVETINSSNDVKSKIKDIELSLKQISEIALWPSFLDSNNELGSCISLVLINASTWQVPGVWAMHILATCNDKNNSPLNLLNLVEKSLTEAPMQCLNDALGATLAIEGRHSEKLKMLLFYKNSLGAELSLADINSVENYEQGDNEIYEIDWPSDPYNKFDKVYNLIFKNKLSSFSLTEIITPDSEYANSILNIGFIIIFSSKDYPNFSFLLLKELFERIKIRKDGSSEIVNTPQFDFSKVLDKIKFPLTILENDINNYLIVKSAAELVKLEIFRYISNSTNKQEPKLIINIFSIFLKNVIKGLEQGNNKLSETLNFEIDAINTSLSGISEDIMQSINKINSL